MSSKETSGSGEDTVDTVYAPPREESNHAATTAAEPPPPREESNAAATAAAEPPPPREESNAAATAAAEPSPPVEVPQGSVPERPDEGGESPSVASAAEAEAAAAAAADRKGKKVAVISSSSSSSSPSSSVDSSSRRIHDPEASGSGTGAMKVSWKEPMVQEVVGAPKEVMPVNLNDAFDDMLQEAGAKETKKGKVKPPSLWPKKKQSIWRIIKVGMKKRLLEWMERHMPYSKRNSRSTKPHVHHLIIPVPEMIQHYELLRGQGEIINSNALLLRRAYSGFRPVLADGECFYRSFIFSYLEQVLDRQDTHEEHRLLTAVKEVARQYAQLGWTFDFSNSYKAFKKLIKKVMRWKCASTSASYHRKKLLEFFSGYETTEHIFAFLRLVAATWIYSHPDEYEPRVSGLQEYYTLRDWCFEEVIREKMEADHVQMTALVNALGVPLRVESLFGGTGQNLYTGQDSQDNSGQDPQDNMPRSTCCPRPRGLLPPDHEVPCVTVLFSYNHYDIIYPHRRIGSLPFIDEGCSQGTGPGGESSTASCSN